MLNEKQKLFCRELLKNKFNATKAYQKAYPDCSKESSRIEASRLLTNDNVEKYIQKLTEKEEKKDLITVKEVLEGIKEDITDAKSVRQYSAALKGRELLGKYLKMFTEKIEHDGNIDLNITKKVIND